MADNYIDYLPFKGTYLKNQLLKLLNKIVVLNIFVKAVYYDLTPFGSDCPYPMGCIR